MGEPIDNPRALREANRRFEYNVRNQGMDRAMIEMQERNAVRRESDRRTAARKATDHMVNATEKHMRQNPRTFNSNHFSD